MDGAGVVWPFLVAKDWSTPLGVWTGRSIQSREMVFGFEQRNGLCAEMSVVSACICFLYCGGPSRKRLRDGLLSGEQPSRFCRSATAIRYTIGERMIGESFSGIVGI